MRNGIDDKTAALEAELAEIHGQLADAERDGAEIAALAEETIRKLKGELARLQNTTNDYCKSCQRKREVIAALVGGVFLGVWFHINAPGNDWDLTWLGIWLSVIPLLSVLMYWQVLLFCRKYAWVSWKDNDIYRRISARWNGSLERARMR